MERCSNEAGRFIQCMVNTAESRKVTLIFSEERAVLEGCSTPAIKLHDLCVPSSPNLSRRALVAKSRNEDAAIQKSLIQVHSLSRRIMVR